MENIIFNAVLLLISIGGFLLGKFVFPNVPKSVADKLRQLAAWADKFVVWAREFMKTSSGHEKMEMVVEQLEAIAKEAGLNVTKDQLRAIAQAAYENMMKGAAEAQQPQEIAQATKWTAEVCGSVHGGYQRARPGGGCARRGGCHGQRAGRGAGTEPGRQRKRI